MVAAEGKLLRAAHQEAGGVVGASPVDAANGGEEAGAPGLPHARRGIGIVCAAGCAAAHRFTMLPKQCKGNSCSALNPISTAAGSSGRPARSLTGAARPLLLRPVDVAAAGGSQEARASQRGAMLRQAVHEGHHTAAKAASSCSTKGPLRFADTVRSMQRPAHHWLSPLTQS